MNGDESGGGRQKLNRSTGASVVACRSLLLAGGFLVGCGESSPSAPTAVTAVPLAPPTTSDTPVVFTELATGFSTSDLRDIDEQILQVTRDGALVWTVDGTRPLRIPRRIVT